jgi:hypothetical protein
MIQQQSLLNKPGVVIVIHTYVHTSNLFLVPTQNYILSNPRLTTTTTTTLIVPNKHVLDSHGDRR